MDHAKEHAKCCLEANRFRVADIPECETERADLLVTDAVDTYVMEVKEKDVSEACQKMIAESNTDGSASLTRDVERRNRIDGILKKAESQLAQTPAPENSFRVVWVSCLSGDVDFIHKEFRLTIYGTQELVLFDRNGKFLWTLQCFYYNYSTFYRYRDIDAVILSGSEAGHLCVNAFSPRLAAFQKSSLYTMFPDRAVVDPSRLEAAGTALVIESDIDRSDEKAKRQYLLDRYGFMTAPMHASHFTGRIAAPLDRAGRLTRK